MATVCFNKSICSVYWDTKIREKIVTEISTAFLFTK
jgi:hypothetical protein